MSWYSRRRSSRRDYGWGGFAPYVPVAERRRKAEKEAAKLGKKGQTLSPVQLEGKTIARSFWGKSWCENLESYSDYSNRLPRGRTYVRNGSVLHLDIRQGEIEALVSGSSLYKIKVKIKPVDRKRWAALCHASAGSIGSLMELLQGRLSEQVMAVMTHREHGLFPTPKEIELSCSCPDWADMCKHVAAVLYGVGARLDEKPELLFLLRHVDHQELVSQAGSITALTETKEGAALPTLSADDVGAVFGIEMEAEAPAEAAPTAPPRRTVGRKAAKKKPSPPAPAPRTAQRKTAKKKPGRTALSKSASSATKARRKGKEPVRVNVGGRRPAHRTEP